MPRSEGPVDPAARDKYLLRVTCGPSYDPSTHKEVPVNSTTAEVIENDLMTCYLHVRIKDYHGLPHNSPSSSAYFSHPQHTSDRYSISFSFVPKKDISGEDLVTGFDFDHSIRDRLPPGFKYAMRIVTTLLDPGIYSDPYSDKPYLYGPALSSFFSFRIGDHTSDVPVDQQLATFENENKAVVLEGAEGSGQRIRADQHIPAKINKRRKHFLDAKALKGFTFEKGRLYQADVFNPYLDFANFGLRLPGFSISVVRYIDDKTHQLRYVLKNRRTEEVLFVVIFTLLFGQKLEDTLENREKGAQAEENTLERPQTSSSCESPAPSERSSSPVSDISDTERESRATAAGTLANTIYGSFARLGFGRTASSSSESSTASTASPPPGRPRRKTLEEKIDELDDSNIEELLKSRHSAV